MLLTSPLVVTVGLSLTIPLSLVGQMILDSQFSSFTYWLGAGIVFLSFIVVNHESKQEQSQESEEGTADRGPLADASSLNR
jgi:solute carrier family 35, member F5